MASTDVLAALRWWLTVSGIGIAATPITLFLLQRLPDRGYAFAKLVGLLLVGYFFWLFGSLGLWGNNTGGVIVAVALLATSSIWAIRRESKKHPEGPTTLEWLREKWRYILTVELIFFSIFTIWTWVRSQNPAITGTEKPMEFAFLNSMGRSPELPPLDPWMSGFAISYYYFGYVITSIITRLAGVHEAVGFNLAIAWLAASSALGAFGLVYNIIASGRNSIKRSAIIFGVVAAIALPIAGNLETGAEVLYANEVGSAEFWEWLDLRDLNDPSNLPEVPRYESAQWWWWRSSRVIHEYSLSGREEAGLEPIAEFPGFSFVLGDLHSHVIALPFAFLSLAVALCWWQKPSSDEITAENHEVHGSFAIFRSNVVVANKYLLLFTILLLGGLSFLNTWDVLIHLFIIVASFTLGLWRRNGGWRREILKQGAILSLILVAGSLILYLPFYIGFRSQAGPPFLLPMIMKPTRLAHFVVMFGMPLIGVTGLLIALTYRAVRSPSQAGQRNYSTKALIGSLALILILMLVMVLLGFLIASSEDYQATIFNLAQDLDLALPERSPDLTPLSRIQWAISAMVRLVPSLFQARMPHSALITFLLLMGFLALYLVMRLLDKDLTPGGFELEKAATNSTPSILPFVLLLIITGVLLTLGPEFVYIKDNFGHRMNTIFKFYYQAWVLFGVSAIFSLDYLLRKSRITGVLIAVLYTAAFLVSLLFPYYAIQSRALEYRGSVTSENRAQATLDGLAYIDRYNPDELDAINWMRTNIKGTPVVLEAVGGQYTNFGRVSASTGLPTVLGWAGHEYQWRGSTPEPAQRGSAVEAIYEARSWDMVTSYLNQYDVSFIFLGANEKNTYGARAEELFDQHLDLAFQNNSVKIYRWTPSS